MLGFGFSRHNESLNFFNDLTNSTKVRALIETGIYILIIVLKAI